MNIVNDWILNPRLWLPKNYTWDDLISQDPNYYYGEPKDLAYSFYTAFFLFFLRMFVERCIWEPIGRYFGLTHRKYYKADSNLKLEMEYKRQKRPTNIVIKDMSTMYNLEEIYIQRWFRRRRNQNKSDVLTKFKESGWRFVYYLSIFLIGCWVLSDQEFIWDAKKMWVNVPFVNITPYMFWYIMIELGYYWASLFTVFFDVKRKIISKFSHVLCGMTRQWLPLNMLLCSCPFVVMFRPREVIHSFSSFSSLPETYWMCATTATGESAAARNASTNSIKGMDFWEMLIHHLVTIFLICMAWLQNFIGVSMFVLCLHDFVDYFMEAAKMLHYIKQNIICNVLFTVFTVAWFVSRLVIFPTKIIYSAFAHIGLGHFGVHLCQSMLCVLQVLHIMWFIMILRIALQAFDDTGIHKDSRSDSEMSLSDEEAVNDKKKEN